MSINPKLIIIDDEEHHIRGLQEAFLELGIFPLKIRFPEDNLEEGFGTRHVRLIFSDLHLQSKGGKGDEKTHFSNLQGVLRDLIQKDNGPYLLFLWTQDPEGTPRFENYLKERLEKLGEDAEGYFPPPLAVVPIAKRDYLNLKTGIVKNKKDLEDKILEVLISNAEVAALMNWETRALKAAEKVVAELDMLNKENLNGPDDYLPELRKFLGNLAVFAVGQNNVDTNRLHAILEALNPIFLDKMYTLPPRRKETEILSAAFDIPGHPVYQAQAPSLNTIIHLSKNTEGLTAGDRGVVFKMRWPPKKFKKEFGRSKQEVLTHFNVKEKFHSSRKFSFVLVQVQAACDYAQKDLSFLPYVLGVLAEPEIFSTKSRPESHWKSPTFLIDRKSKQLVICSQFLTRFEKLIFASEPVLFRLREQILADISFNLFSYLSRPGIYSLKKDKKL